MRNNLKLISLLFYIFFILLLSDSYSQNIIKVEGKKDDGNPNPIPCLRYNSNEDFEDVIILKISFPPETGQLRIDDLKVDPILAPGITVNNFKTIVKILDHDTGQANDIIGEIIESNSDYVASNGIFTLELRISGIYFYNPNIYNGGLPLLFNLNLFTSSISPNTGVPFNSFVSTSDFNPETEVSCESTNSDSNKLRKTSNLSIFPNPSRDSFVLTFELLDISDVSIEIYNSLGEAINSPILLQRISVGKHQIKMNLNGYSPGIYYVNLLTNEGSKYIRIMKI